MKPATKDCDVGISNAKERPLGSEARQKQFQLLNLGSMFFEPLVFVVGEQAVRSSSGASLHRWSSYSADESVERSARQRASTLNRLWVKDVNRKPTNTDTVTKLLCSSIIIFSFLSLACLSLP